MANTVHLHCCAWSYRLKPHMPQQHRMQSSTGQAMCIAALCIWRGTQHDAGLHQQLNMQLSMANTVHLHCCAWSYRLHSHMPQQYSMHSSTPCFAAESDLDWLCSYHVLMCFGNAETVPVARQNWTVLWSPLPAVFGHNEDEYPFAVSLISRVCVHDNSCK